MNKLQANICLLAVTVCWSFEVVLLSIFPSDMNPFATTCATSLLGAILLFACFARRIVSNLRHDGPRLVRRIFALSVMNASYNILIETGLNFCDVSTGAFTLSMVVVVIPVMLFVMRRGVAVRTWISALFVLVGIIVASFPVYPTIHPLGFATMLPSCIIRALYIVKLSDFAREHDPVTLAAGMTSVNSLITFIPWFCMDPLTFATISWSPELIAAIVVYSYFIVAYATVIIIFAQRRSSPAQAAIIFSTEIVFSVLWATCLPDFIVEHVDITPYIIFGCVFIVLGNLVEVIPFDQLKKKFSTGNADEPDTGASVEHVDQIAQPPSIEGSSSADLVTQILNRLKHPVARKIVLFFILLAVYLVISLPFKVLSIIPGFSDLRPVCMLQPVYGIFFGPPGCFAFAIGNVISDILSDSLRWTSIAGFIGNFAFPYLMYLYWTKLRKKPFNLRTRRMLLRMVLSILVCSLIESLIICPAVYFVYPEVDIVLFTISVVANTSVFSIAFAIPFIILIQEELGFVPLGPKRKTEKAESKTP